MAVEHEKTRPAPASALLPSADQAGRRGSIVSSLLIALSIVGAFSVAALLVTPAYLHGQADNEPLQAVTARVERNQEVIELVADLIGASVEVPAIHERGSSPFAEIVLRISGEGDAVEPGEVALLSHSRVLQTLTLYSSGEAEMALDRAAVADAAFPGKWRGNPDVVPRILATGVSDLKVQVVSPNLLQVALTWAEDSTDGEDEATVYVEAALPFEF